VNFPKPQAPSPKPQAPSPKPKPLHLTIAPGCEYSIGVSNGAARADVLQGTLDLMILQTVAALGPMHGYAIASRIEQVSNGSLRLNMGTLYPGLMRLEQRGLLRAKWGTTDNNRRARFYAITAAGRQQLSAEQAGWNRMVAIINALGERG
jgi:PadR family transcriptional regulator, regulatory protein PadR